MAPIADTYQICLTEILGKCQQGITIIGLVIRYTTIGAGDSMGHPQVLVLRNLLYPKGHAATFQQKELKDTITKVHDPLAVFHYKRN